MVRENLVLPKIKIMLMSSRNHQQLFSDNHYKLSPQTQPYLELIVSRLLQTVSVGENKK